MVTGDGLKMGHEKDFHKRLSSSQARSSFVKHIIKDVTVFSTQPFFEGLVMEAAAFILGLVSVSRLPETLISLN